MLLKNWILKTLSLCLCVTLLSCNQSSVFTEGTGNNGGGGNGGNSGSPSSPSPISRTLVKKLPIDWKLANSPKKSDELIVKEQIDLQVDFIEKNLNSPTQINFLESETKDVSSSLKSKYESAPGTTKEKLEAIGNSASFYIMIRTLPKMVIDSKIASKFIAPSHSFTIKLLKQTSHPALRPQVLETIGRMIASFYGTEAITKINSDIIQNATYSLLSQICLYEGWQSPASELKEALFNAELAFTRLYIEVFAEQTNILENLAKKQNKTLLEFYREKASTNLEDHFAAMAFRLVLGSSRTLPLPMNEVIRNLSDLEHSILSIPGEDGQSFKKISQLFLSVNITPEHHTYDEYMEAWNRNTVYTFLRRSSIFRAVNRSLNQLKKTKTPYFSVQPYDMTELIKELENKVYITTPKENLTRLTKLYTNIRLLKNEDEQPHPHFYIDHATALFILKNTHLLEDGLEVSELILELITHMTSHINLLSTLPHQNPFLDKDIRKAYYFIVNNLCERMFKSFYHPVIHSNWPPEMVDHPRAYKKWLFSNLDLRKIMKGPNASKLIEGLKKAYRYSFHKHILQTFAEARKNGMIDDFRAKQQHIGLLPVMLIEDPSLFELDILELVNRAEKSGISNKLLSDIFMRGLSLDRALKRVHYAVTVKEWANQNGFNSKNTDALQTDHYVIDKFIRTLLTAKFLACEMDVKDLILTMAVKPPSPELIKRYEGINRLKILIGLTGARQETCFYDYIENSDLYFDLNELEKADNKVLTETSTFLEKYFKGSDETQIMKRLWLNATQNQLNTIEAFHIFES